ncbi:Asp/Glu-specific dipeptidyl-peptidase [Thermaurantimonas aggregans]|uniref:Dipeptidyl-peptidase n=1 Tax=Thermaurantimonas aggregans TaxID=2173829 RepID=A0A401XMA6_9FLAO|nr:S46 family peptidase [Thermaurantimonas aggregans]GCD78121.1 Asp/Glu-specific dipeptidyl-peptidase [Thermaurantimonas aggregans]
MLLKRLIRISLFAWFFLHASVAWAIEGMWLPMLLAQLNEGEMKTLGMRISAQDIYSVNQASLKDAVVQFGGGCTGEIISPRGLLLTNHHCGYGQIQYHSTVERDLLKNGFWAMSQAEELKNPGLTAMFVRYMEDVTNDVLKGTHELKGAERQKKLQENIQVLIRRKKVQEGYDYIVRPFYQGNQYILFATETYKDVRLVGTPPSAIGKYGADTDNWVWPRHTGDFAIFRVYAGPDNKPAEISDNNKPFVPRNFLKIYMSGVKPGDFTMVFGFPGRTNQYLPSNEVHNIVNVYNPVKIQIRDTLLALLDRRMRTSDEVRIKYAAKYARIANAWKKWIGETEGVRETKGVERKQRFEAEFELKIAQSPKLSSTYTGTLTALKKAYDDLVPYQLARDYYIETAIQGVELMNFARNFISIYQLPDSTRFKHLLENREKLLASIQEFVKDFDRDADGEAFEHLMHMYVNADLKIAPAPALMRYKKALNRDRSKVRRAVYDRSYLHTLLTEAPEYTDRQWTAALKKLEKDPLYRLSADMYSYFLSDINKPYDSLSLIARDLQADYMKALMEAFPERRFYPDANGTLRVSYGQVEGMMPRDGIWYHHQTYAEGVKQKYKPGDYEFDLPKRYLELYEARNFGRYADASGRLPVCFIASNHTTGGNSGSPALNADGYLIGLNFDRLWEGTMSDINYDISRCRNIMVDVRYILWVVDVYAGAGYLLDEMELVYGK